MSEGHRSRPRDAVSVRRRTRPQRPCRRFPSASCFSSRRGGAPTPCSPNPPTPPPWLHRTLSARREETPEKAKASEPHRVVSGNLTVSPRRRGSARTDRLRRVTPPRDGSARLPPRAPREWRSGYTRKQTSRETRASVSPLLSPYLGSPLQPTTGDERGKTLFAISNLGGSDVLGDARNARSAHSTRHAPREFHLAHSHRVSCTA